jgi:hypothetical protein
MVPGKLNPSQPKLTLGRSGLFLDQATKESQWDIKFSIHPGNKQKWEASWLVHCPFKFIINCLRELGKLAMTPCQECFASANPGTHLAKARPPEVFQKYYFCMKSTDLSHTCQDRALIAFGTVLLDPLWSHEETGSMWQRDHCSVELRNPYHSRAMRHCDSHQEGFMAPAVAWWHLPLVLQKLPRPQPQRNPSTKVTPIQSFSHSVTE